MKRGFLNNSKRPLYPDPGRKSTETNSTVLSQWEQAEKRVFAPPDAHIFFKELDDLDKLSGNFGGTTSCDNLGRTVIITVPPRNKDGPSDPDGHTEWIVLESTLKKVLKTPGYLSSPLLKPTGPASYVIRPTENMGLGMFATRKITVDELIISERPLLVAPTFLGRYEDYLYRAVARMDEADQEAFKALACFDCTHGRSGRLLCTARTNAYGVPDLFDGPEPTFANIYGATGCRLNSRSLSCMFNVVSNFSMESFSFQFRAGRNIEAGEQIFVSYVDFALPASERLDKLAPYGITKCICAACTHATPEADKLHKEFGKRIAEYAETGRRLLMSPKSPIDESVLDEVTEFRKALIKEGLHATQFYPLLLPILMGLNAKLGRRKEAMVYENEMRESVYLPENVERMLSS